MNIPSVIECHKKVFYHSECPCVDYACSKMVRCPSLITHGRERETDRISLWILCGNMSYIETPDIWDNIGFKVM